MLGKRGNRSIGRLALWLVGLAAVVVAVAVALVVSGAGMSPAPATTAAVAKPPAAQRQVARARVAPAKQARVGTLNGGVVDRLTVQVGAMVDERQELARVSGGGGVEVLTAPWSGTVTSVPIHLGDTVMPGTVVATVSDLSRLHVETTDVDEFQIADIRPGQNVTMTVDALDRRTYGGRVRTVALQPQVASSGDEHYPIVIEIIGPTADLRPGMTTRVFFSGVGD